MPNVSSSSRDLLLRALCCLCGRPFSPPAFPVALPDQMPSTIRSVRSIYPGFCLGSSNVLSAALPPRFDFSIVKLLFARVCPPSIFTLHASCPTFSAAARYHFATVAVGNTIALLGRINTSRCSWQAYTVRIGEFSYRSTSRRDIDLCGTSITSTASNCCCRLPRPRFKAARSAS